MSHKFEVQATLSVSNATVLVDADSAEEALEKANETPLSDWNLDRSWIAVHTTHSPEQLAKEEARRQLTYALGSLREVQSTMSNLDSAITAEVDALLSETGDKEEELRKILGIEKCESKT